MSRPSAVCAWQSPLAISGLAGVVIAFSLDFLAVQLTSPRVAGTLFAVDPVMSALIGAVALGDRLTGAMLAGIALVVASGAAVIWLSGRNHPTVPPLGPDASGMFANPPSHT